MTTRREKQRASSLAGLTYAFLYPGLSALIVLAAGADKSIAIPIAATIGALSLCRAAVMSVSTDGETLWVKNFWSSHTIPAFEIDRVERRELLFSVFLVIPNSDVPVIVRRTGRRIPVVVGAGGNRKVERVIAAVGRGEVPDDGRMSPAELWQRISRRR